MLTVNLAHAKAHLSDLLDKVEAGEHATGLRAGDALRLAIAANRRADTINSFDETMIRAGKLPNLPVNAEVGED